MGGKPDIIKAIVLIFAVGLVITGFTSIHASEDKPRIQDSVVIGAVQAGNDRLNR
ncbi:hypothetical protein KFJ24_12990 [Marinobacter sediminum]|uniref:hypothetical protein n=1 Tax=Marinobacter sediminum TaxID=256323 RepID=UPI00202F28E9|nr:hypothetical protein [Marinobacter sediminum]MCM0613391.1 hypothetical protein [Marinobacter sediminum]